MGHFRIEGGTRSRFVFVPQQQLHRASGELLLVGAPGLAVLARILAYLLAGIPAAIGAAFVARYAFVTSDTAIDGASNAFLFGMIAAGAFGGPAVAVALASNGRKLAAGIFGVLAVLAMATNWSHTLGAVAHRGAGTEAEREGQG